MRSGDVRRVCLLIALAACERRAPRTEPHGAGSAAPPRVSVPAAAVTLGPELPGCEGRWWPLADGQRLRWRIARASVPGPGADDGAPRRVREVRDTIVRALGGGRYRLDWPAPWTDALVAPLTIAVDGTTIRDVTDLADTDGDAGTRAPGAAWLELGAAASPGGPERTVTPASATRAAELTFTWRTLADDVTVRLACGTGPVAFAYHHHGTLEELTAVRVDPVPGAPGQ